MSDQLATVTIYSESARPIGEERVEGDCTIHRQVNGFTGRKRWVLRQWTWIDVGNYKVDEVFIGRSLWSMRRSAARRVKRYNKSVVDRAWLDVGTQSGRTPNE